MTEKICETCKYAEVPFYEEPCRSCDVNTNDKWKPQKRNTELRYMGGKWVEVYKNE